MNSLAVTEQMLRDLEISLAAINNSELISKLEKDNNALGKIKPKECRAEAERVIGALKKISPDVSRGKGNIELSEDKPTDYWLGVIWALADLQWKIGKEIARKWSQGSNRFTEDGFEAAWNSYDPHYRNPISIRSVFKLAEKFGHSVTDTSTKKPATPDPTASPLAILNRFSLTGSSAQMKKQMLADVFAMEGIAILGQWTTLYAAPNTGKTLLALWLLEEQISAGIIDGGKVYYVNADDTYRGAVHKIELAEKWGMHMLVPGHNDFKASLIPAIMEKLANAGEARGVVLVLDTLKKFTDLMDKTAATAFGVTAREFIAAGGTLICLAHTNKHKDADGKGIYSGTSDIVDDSDCMFVIDKLSAEGNDVSKAHTVEFTNKKARGDVSSTAMYTYVKRTGEPYSALLGSVKRIGNAEVDAIKKATERNVLLAQDEEIIRAILSCISKGVITKSELIKAAMAEADASKTRVKNVLERWTGDKYEEGQRWAYKAGEHNKFSYSLTTPPL